MSKSVFRATSLSLLLAGLAMGLLGGSIACGTNNGAVDALEAKDAGKPKKDAAKDEEGDDDDDDDTADVQQPPVEDPDGGDAAAPFVWPDCLSKPATATTRSISEVWTQNASKASETWVHDAFITGISGGGCTAGKACQIFLQEGSSYPTLAAAAHHAIKLFVSGNTSKYFTAAKVGDQVDALGWAWRYNLDGQNELLLQVNLQYPGCVHATTSGNTVSPVPNVTLTDLTLTAYEQTYGPVLIQVNDVSGRPTANASETFGLWTTGFEGSFPDGGTGIVSLSPYFIKGGAFSSGFTAGKITEFERVVGVFGVFLPAGQTGTPQKYLEIYARSGADIVRK